jgi:hypothetical protein
MKRWLVPVQNFPVPGLCGFCPGRKLLPAVMMLAVSVSSFAHAQSDGVKADEDAKPALNYHPAVHRISGPGERSMVAGTGHLIIKNPEDPAIRRALDEVSPARIEKTITTLVGFRNRNTLSSMDGSSMDSGLPAGQGVNAAAAWIEAELRRYSADCGGCLDVRLDTFTEPVGPRIPRPTTITNVYAILRGADPLQAKRMFLVTGHYDSRGTDVLDTRTDAPGANDDASGVAVSLECARVLSRLHLPATLVFVAVAGEEQGLNGSAHLAHLARSEGWQLEGVLNNDIVGGDSTPGDGLQNKSAVRVFSEGIPVPASPDDVKAIVGLGGESDSPSRELARVVADVARTYLPEQISTTARRLRESEMVRSPLGVALIFRRDRFLRGGDHTSFNKEGFAAVRFTEWRENFNHQHQDVRIEGGVEFGDLLKFVDFKYVAKVARLNAATLATLASAPGAPRDVRIETKGLNNDTTLRWTAPEGFGGASDGGGLRYEVVWRDTSAADWDYSQSWAAAFGPAGQMTVTLPVSKDNVIFGVRSVDAAGHRSLVVIPAVER